VIRRSDGPAGDAVLVARWVDAEAAAAYADSCRECAQLVQENEVAGVGGRLDAILFR